MISQTAMSESPTYQARRGSTGYAEGEAGADRARVLGRDRCARLLPRSWLCSGTLANHFGTLRSQPLRPPDFVSGREEKIGGKGGGIPVSNGEDPRPPRGSFSASGSRRSWKATGPPKPKCRHVAGEFGCKPSQATEATLRRIFPPEETELIWAAGSSRCTVFRPHGLSRCHRQEPVDSRNPSAS